MRFPTIAALALAGLLAAGSIGHAQSLPDGFVDHLVLGSLDHPTALQFLPDGRLLFVEQLSARMRLIVNGAIASVDPVVTVPDVFASGERGLLGVALDPGFPARPYVYVHATVDPPHRIRISRFTLTGDLSFTGDGHLAADPASRFDVLDSLADNAGNHNGGTVRFGTDGMLYVSLGEDAEFCDAQVPDSLRGVILRLDVSGLPAGPGHATRPQVTPSDNPFVSAPGVNARLVGAYGLRNPFRFQLDPLRQWLVITDVGENVREEMDLLRLPGGAAGAADLGSDFGWPAREGTVAGANAGSCPVPTATLVEPIFDYDRTSQPIGAAAISAGAYRAVLNGTANWPAEYEGDLFMDDYYTGEVRRLHASAGAWDLAVPVAGQPSTTFWATGLPEISDFRVGPDGALWYCRQSVSFSLSALGSIHRIAFQDTTTSTPPPPPSFSFAPGPIPSPGSTTLRFSIGGDTYVRLLVFDARGDRVRTLLPGSVLPAGSHAPLWDGADDDGRALPSGLYFVQLELGGRRISRAIPLIR